MEHALTLCIKRMQNTIWAHNALGAPWRSMLRIQDSRFWGKLLGSQASSLDKGSLGGGSGSKKFSLRILNLESRGGKSGFKEFLLESWILNPKRLYTKNITIEILHACILQTILDSKSKIEWFVSNFINCILRLEMIMLNTTCAWLSWPKSIFLIFPQPILVVNCLTPYLSLLQRYR